MSKIRAKPPGLLGLIDSDNEEDQLVAQLPSPDTSLEAVPAVKKGRAKARKTAAKSPIAPTKVTKTKAPARRGVTKDDAASKKKGGRKILADKTNLPTDEDSDDLDVEMEDPQKEITALNGKGKIAPKKAGVTKANITAKTAPEAPGKQASKRGRSAKKDVEPQPSPEKVVPETQLEDEMDTEEEAEAEIDETIVEPTKHKTLKLSKDDPSDLKRQIAELTKKYNNLSTKYDQLRDVGIKQAETNFDNFRMDSESRSKHSADMIASLKSDLAHKSSLAKDANAIKAKLESQKLDFANLKVQLADMRSSLATSQAETKSTLADLASLRTTHTALQASNKALTAENKTLSAKLAANRSAAASVESVNTRVVPGSAVKSNGGIRMVGTAEAAQLAQAAQLKEDVYSDLTGLIIQGVKRDSDEDVFNCLQTGRNGTLHFKLSAANEHSSEGYADAECGYVPQLDPSRDASLIDVLPDYLTEEISFPRKDAAKFYARVVRALTDKNI